MHHLRSLLAGLIHYRDNAGRRALVHNLEVIDAFKPQSKLEQPKTANSLTPKTNTTLSTQ
jgi:hypothetical protein